MKHLKKMTKLTAASFLSIPAIFIATPTQAELSGNLSVVSEYQFRGTAENNNAAMQGGLDYGHENGVYIGYWGSSLDYGDSKSTTGYENDFYIGYSAETGSMSYDLGLTYYYYTGVEDSDTPELYASLGYGPVSIGLAYLMDDVSWGNEGDIYWSLAYETDLPSDFGFSATAGFFTYEEEGKFISKTTTSIDSGFKHLDLTLSHPLADSGADMSITYMVGGKDRKDVDVEDAVILGVSFGF